MSDEAENPFNGADPKAFDHDGDNKPGGSRKKAPSVAAEAPRTPEDGLVIETPERGLYITTRTTEGYGPRGHFLELTQVEAGAGQSSGVLRPPTADELARRSKF